MQPDCDLLARRLIDLGAQTAALPPSWAGAGDYYPLCGPDGERIGRILPGQGVLLFDDLKNHGITKKLPHVFERSLALRLLDVLRSERGAITTYAGLIAARDAGKHGQHTLPWNKGGFSATAGNWHHTFTVLNGGSTPAGSYTAIPGGEALDQDTVGGFLKGLSTSSAPDKVFLASLAYGAELTIRSAIILDMLVAAGTISATVNTSQTINTASLTRNTSGAGVLAFLEVTTALGTGTPTVALTYTNQDGTGSRVTPNHTMTASVTVTSIPYAGTIVPFMALQAGDYGMRSVQSLQLSAGMSAGALAIILAKPMTWLWGIPPNVAVQIDLPSSIVGVIEAPLTSGNKAGCYSMLFTTSSTATVSIRGNVQVITGD